MPRRRVIWDHVHLFVEMPPAGGLAGATRHRRAPPDFGSTTRLRQHRSTSAAPVVPRGVPAPGACSAWRRVEPRHRGSFG